MPVSFKGAHFPQDIILMGVRWYVAYPLSYRHVEELMEERGVPVEVIGLNEASATLLERLAIHDKQGRPALASSH